MTNSKTLMLAAVAALSLGVGTAMAQEGEILPSYQTPAFPTPAYLLAAPTTAQPQAGSSDLDQRRGDADQSRGYVQQPALYGAAGTGG